MQGELFGHVPQRGDHDQPAKSDHRILQHTPETIRAEMHRILAEARAAETLPWSPRWLRKHTAGFPYVAEWLKDGEGDRLMAEFKAELDRLQAPVDQVAPNWREIWGLAA